VQAGVDKHEATFRRIVGAGIWVGTSGIKGGVQWWYNKEPVLWLPAGTFPAWVEWVLAFPKAPKGMIIVDGTDG